MLLHKLAQIVYSVTHSTTSPIAKLIYSDPENWCVEEYKVHHKPSDISIWTANGVAHIRVERKIGSYSEYKPSWSERRLIWNAYKSMLLVNKQVNQHKIYKLIEEYFNNLKP